MSARAVESPRLDSQQSEARIDTTEASQNFDLHLYIETDKQREKMKMFLVVIVWHFRRRKRKSSPANKPDLSGEESVSVWDVPKNTLYSCI